MEEVNVRDSESGLIKTIKLNGDIPLVIDGKQAVQWCDLKDKTCYDPARGKCQYARVYFLE